MSTREELAEASSGIKQLPHTLRPTIYLSPFQLLVQLLARYEATSSACGDAPFPVSVRLHFSFKVRFAPETPRNPIWKSQLHLNIEAAGSFGGIDRGYSYHRDLTDACIGLSRVELAFPYHCSPQSFLPATYADRSFISSTNARLRVGALRL